MDKLNKLWPLNINIKTFRWYIVGSMISLDLFNVSYLQGVLNKVDLERSILLSAQMQGMSSLPAQSVDEMQGLVINAFWMLIGLFIINNLIFYALFCLNRKTGRKYVRMLSSTGAILTFICIFMSNQLWGERALLAFQAIWYGHVYLYLKKFSDQTHS